MSASIAQRLLALWLLLAGVSPAFAASVFGLYEGQVAVSGKDESERVSALGAALRQVISKLTGLERPDGAVVEAAVADARSFLQQYGYRDTGDALAPLALWAQFEPAAVDAIVRDARLPVWGGQRPNVLAWVVLARADGRADGADGPEIVAAESDAEGLLGAMRQRAWERGVQLSFPLLDLEERVRIQASDLWTLDAARIGEASQRYGAVAMLVGLVESAAGGPWLARWWFEDGGGASQWESRAASAGQVAAGAMDALADRLAARYAMLPGDSQAVPGGLEVRVSGVRSVADYARTMDYLQRLDQISELTVSAVRGEDVAFRMQVRGGEEGLRRVLAFGGVLEAEPVTQEGGALRFRLLP